MVRGLAGGEDAMKPGDEVGFIVPRSHPPPVRAKGVVVDICDGLVTVRAEFCVPVDQCEQWVVAIAKAMVNLPP
jgi:hypothetical protein